MNIFNTMAWCKINFNAYLTVDKTFLIKKIYMYVFQKCVA